MSEPNDHRTIFQQYIRAGVQASLARVQAAEYEVPETDRQQAWHMLSFALDAPEAWDTTRALLLALAPKMELAGFRDEWLPYLEQGVQASKQHGDPTTEAELALQIGILQRLVSKFDQSRHWLTASIGQFTRHGQIRNRARALNELAWLDYLQQRYQEAADHVEQALTGLKDEDVERGMSYRVLGMLDINQARWQEAEIYHRKALSSFETEGNLRKIARGLANLAGALLGQDRLQESSLYYQQVAIMLEELGDSYHLAIVQMNLGIVYYRQRELSESALCHLKADTMFRKLYDSINLAHNCTNLGKTNQALLELTTAKKNFLEAIAIYERLGETGWRLNAMDGLAMTLSVDQRYDQAIDILEQALLELPTVQGNSNYDYLYRSLNKHLLEARHGQESLVRHS